LARYCSIAMGSASELEYHLLLARDLKLILAGDHERVQTQVSEVKRMLAGLLLKLTAER
jgi:four helix bundle protein